MLPRASKALTKRAPASPARWVLVSVLASALGLLLATTVPASAQDTGTITGAAIDARTGAPVSGVQVFLPRMGIGSVTGGTGTFLLVNVPAGSHEIRAVRIGYRAASQEITVRAGETHTVEFQLAGEVLGLDEIVVTGEAGHARRREVGHTVSQIDVARVAEPAHNVESLLQARATGLSITEAAGMAGSGSMIRLRGNVSVAMSNQPLVYVDGVRVRSDAYPKNVPPTGYTGRSGNVKASPLNDLNPNDIERIEIIKGAAATTLYGTEAAAGVIQIFTKRGTEGRTRWTFQTDQGFSQLLAWGPPEAPHFRLDPWLRRGHQQSYYLSARGGIGDVRYFVAGSWQDHQFILPKDWEEKLSVRGNFGFSPLDNLDLEWNTSLTLTEISNVASGNNAHGITLNTYRGDVAYVGGYSKENVDKIFNQDILSEIDHVITGFTTRFTPTPNFWHRFNVGYSRASTEMRQLRPFGFVLAPNGILSNQRWSGETLTLDYAGNYGFGLTESIGTTVSWGGQFIETTEKGVHGEAQEFPGPGEPTLTSGAVSLSFEDRMRVITAGFFGQARFDFADRLFLTAGVRVDGNSAFGSELGLEPYPKVSASYVISDEAFWPERLGAVKLRAAYGHSGRAPGAFDAVRTWQPVRVAGSPGFLPLNPGNPELGPERTAEVEVGFDGSFLNDRLTAEFTYYHQTTTDALFNVRRPPSLGDWQAQLENVGKLRNTGIELALNGTVVQRPSLTWDLGVGITTNHSEILDLGDATPFTVGQDAWIEEGRPAPVLLGWKVMNPNELADPIIEQDYYFGPNQPTLIIIPSTMVRLPRGIIVSARGEFQGGHYMYDGASFNGISRATDWPTCLQTWELQAAGRGDEVRALERARCDRPGARTGLFIYPADFFKLRDVTLQVPVDFVVPWGESPVLTLSARNFVRWFNSEWWEMDPEMGTNEGHDSLVRQITEHIPPTARFVASFRVNF